SDRGQPLLPRPEARSRPHCGALPRRTPAEIPGLVRAPPRAEQESPRLARRRTHRLRGSVAVPGRRGTPVRVPERDGTDREGPPARGRAARSRRGAAERRELLRVGAADRVQRGRNLPPLSRARRLAPAPGVATGKEPQPD